VVKADVKVNKKGKHVILIKLSILKAHDDILKLV